MRILMINSVCGIRSTGRICTDLAKRLTQEGHEVKIAYGRIETVPKAFQKYAVRIGDNWDLRFHAIRTRILDEHGFGSVKATRDFLVWAEQYDPQILWLHNIHGYYINIEMLFDWIKSRPNMEVKWTLHDCWAFTGHCSHFSYVKCNQWSTQCKHCVQLRRYPACFVVGSVNKNFERKRKAFTGVKNMTLITPSRWLATLTRQSFLKEYPVEVHYNAIDTTVFKPTASKFREKQGLLNKIIVLGVASIWEDRKGLSDFMRLAEILDDKYVIVLVGLSKKQIANLPSNMVGITHTNSTKELAEIYTAADVFVNLTYEDNYPTVNLEAQACGTKVITYDTGGCRETIYTEKSCIVPTGCLDEVITIICKGIAK